MYSSISLRKGVYILPNLFTTASLFAAFLCMFYAAERDFENAALAVLLSAVLDGIDGKIARLTKTTSNFGTQYDSLADVVAFGVAPAMLMYFWVLESVGRLGMLACFLFGVCGALRLARFNVQSTAAPSPVSKKFFTGLPIPAAGCALATMVFFSQYIPAPYDKTVLPKVVMLFMAILAVLMVSRVRYASFKNYGAFKVQPFGYMILAILLFILIASNPSLLGFLFMTGYILSGPVYTYIFMPRRHPTNTSHE